MKKILFVPGIITLIYGISLVLFTNFTLGTLLTLIIGIFLIVWGMYFNKIQAASKSGVKKGIKISILIFVCFEIILIGFIAVYGIYDSCDYKEDAVIVLGAGIKGDKPSYALKLRLDKAVEYHQKNPDAYIVVTGGMGPQENTTEAYAMEKYLISKGVDENIIIKEEHSTSTNENMRFAKELLDERFDKSYRAVVITNNFHIYRAEKIAEDEGIKNISTLHCSMHIYDIIPVYLRESLAVLKLWVVGR